MTRPVQRRYDIPALRMAAEVFKSLSDVTRLDILVTLGEREMCVHDLCERLHLSQPAISHKLRTLRLARLVRARRAGREIHYSIADGHVFALVGEALAHVGEAR